MDGVFGAIRSFAKVMKDFVEHDYGGHERNGGNNNHAIERFRRMRPLKFKDTLDPIEAETWLMNLEEIFDMIGCEDE